MGERGVGGFGGGVGGGRLGGRLWGEVGGVEQHTSAGRHCMTQILRLAS